jgi:hypothetical protein
MAGRISYYGGIVKNGLIFDLDAAKQLSYDGTTVWKDISGNGYNASLVNGPTFNSFNKGSIYFDNTNDYVQISSNLDLNSLAVTRNFTICFVAKKLFYGTGGNNTGDSYILLGAGNGYDSGFRITENNLGTPGTAMNVAQRYNLGFTPTGNTMSITSPSGVTSLPSFVCFSISGTSTVGFIDGAFTTSTFLTPYRTGTTGNLIGLGTYGVGYFGGYISSFQIYNRSLTNAEITQNYNAMKTRFGL